MTGQSAEQEKKNKRMLVPVPYSEVQKALERFSQSQQLRESTLVTKYAPKDKKAISPSALKWPKLLLEMEDVTSAVLPKREPRAAHPAAPAVDEDDEPTTPPPAKKKKQAEETTVPPPSAPKKKRPAPPDDDGDDDPPIQYTAAPAEDRRRFLQGGAPSMAAASGTNSTPEAPPVSPPPAPTARKASAAKLVCTKEVRELDIEGHQGHIGEPIDFGDFVAPHWAKKAVVSVEYLL